MAATTYRPIRQFGGWGIRLARDGRVFSTSGNQGVKLTFADGKFLLIGSQKPDALAEAIENTHSRL